MVKTDEKKAEALPENGIEKGETNPNRDHLGQFVKGSAGGPGRGKKKKKEIGDFHEVYSEAIEILHKALKSDDEKISLRAANILATVFSNYQNPGQQVINPEVIELLNNPQKFIKDAEIIDGDFD